jgi:hypothetical protein
MTIRKLPAFPPERKDEYRVRSRQEIERDVAKLKEADYWRTRSGHTAAVEAEQYKVAQDRLKKDFQDDLDLLQTVVTGDDKAFENRVDVLLSTIEQTTGEKEPNEPSKCQ